MTMGAAVPTLWRRFHRRKWQDTGGSRRFPGPSTAIMLRFLTKHQNLRCRARNWHGIAFWDRPRLVKITRSSA